MINEEEVIKYFKKKFESMTYEERQEYLDRYGFKFEEKEEVKHGHWIRLNCMSFFTYDSFYQCSECGLETTNPTDYCGGCGAKMDERSAGGYYNEELK